MLSSKKPTGIDTIPPKLIKVTVDFLARPLTKSSIEHNIFPDLAKTTLVVPLSKGKPNKNDISNFQPTSKTFSRIYETVIKYFMELKMFSHHSFLHIEKIVIYSTS